jgi:hypothetical protein
MRQSAVDEISAIYLEGEDILVADMRSALVVETANLSTTTKLCGAIAQWLSLETAIFATRAFSSESPMVQDPESVAEWHAGPVPPTPSSATLPDSRCDCVVL